MLKAIAKISLFLFLILSFTLNIYATSPQSDYNYQLTKYRRYNNEFTALKQDYLNNPTLDNEQKTLLAAKQLIASRETIKIAYLDILLDSINIQQTSLKPINKTKAQLESNKNFYTSQIIMARNISNRQELVDFNKNYIKAQIPFQSNLIKAQAIRKMAIIIKIQKDLKESYNSLLPRLINKDLPSVSTGLAQVSKISEDVNQLIAANLDFISKLEITSANKDNFFNEQVKKLKNIKNLQLNLVNIIIDLDQNYAN